MPRFSDASYFQSAIGYEERQHFPRQFRRNRMGATAGAGKLQTGCSYIER